MSFGPWVGLICRLFDRVKLGWSITDKAPSWWRHQMEIFSALLALCAGNSPVTGLICRLFDRVKLGWSITDKAPSWWRHQMEIFSALLALCAGNSPVTGEFPVKRPVTRSFYVFFDLHPEFINDWVNNGAAGDLRRHHAHCDVIVMIEQGSVIIRSRWQRSEKKCNFAAAILIKIRW